MALLNGFKQSNTIYKMKHYVLQIAILIFILTSCNPEKHLYKSALKTNTIDGYENYLASYENSQYESEVTQKIENLKFCILRDSVFLQFITIKEDSSNLQDLITINPSNKVLAGTNINLELNKLPKDSRITLHAYRRYWYGLCYSFACFKTDKEGKILLNKNEPITATYTGIDSLGIFWSMTKPTYKNEELPFNINNLDWNTVYFQLESEGKIISKKDLQLVKTKPGIECEVIKQQDLVANFYYPENKQNIPLIILLGGSEGGIGANEYAKIISLHGYAVMALGYFGMENLPKGLIKVPLEYFYNAIDWAKEKQFIDTNKIVIAGGSIGGEAALLVASMRKDIKGVVAAEPSNVMWQGISNGLSGLFFRKSSWTLNGKELPYLKHNTFSVVKQYASGKTQIEFLKMHEAIFTEDYSEIEPAIIKVEKINGPVLLIAGKDSKMWPSYYMCEEIRKRLDSLNFEHPVEYLYYDNVGHKIPSPELEPTIDYKYHQLAVGGTDSENAAAQIDSWNRMIKFLEIYFPVE